MVMELIQMLEVVEVELKLVVEAIVMEDMLEVE